MGMSASQMRYCMIAGKKSDVEYQGQQINQQRTVLATETAALNSQLLDMTVPTAPSSDNYQTTTYSFNNNGQACTVTGTKYNNVSGTYTVNYTTSQTTSKGEFYGSGLCKYTLAGYTYNGNTLTQATSTVDLDKVASIQSDAGTPTHFIKDGSNYQGLNAVVTTSGTTGFNSVVANAFGKLGSGLNPNDYQYYAKKDGSGNITKVYFFNKTSQLNGVTATDPTASNAVTCSSYDVGTSTVNTADSIDTYAETYYSTTQNGKQLFVSYSDMLTNAGTSNKISSYNYNTSATQTSSAQLTGANVTWSSSGRMSSITDSNGNTYSLSVTTTADTSAYNDAVNEWDYQKSIYENKMEQINAKISVIQSEDKKLELKLQDLDTQQQALSTEMDSVKKVIDKNIESSFKAFA
jgi:hypothetical protein